jgi:hypothetical protein
MLYDHDRMSDECSAILFQHIHCDFGLVPWAKKYIIFMHAIVI